MNSKGGMNIKRNQRRVQGIESNRKRTKEEIREAAERGRERKNLWGPSCFEHKCFMNPNFSLRGVFITVSF